MFSNWESFVPTLHVRFGTSAFDDPMEVLTRMSQTSIVALYTVEFEAVSYRVKGLSPLHKLSCFLSGLRDEIRLPVRMLNPQSLNEAFGLAKIQEEYVWSSRKSIRSHQESGNTSILGLPKSNVVLDTKKKYQLRELLLLKWMKGERKGCVIIVMRNEGLGVSVKMLNCFS